MTPARSQIVLVSLDYGGHHAQHLECLASYWGRRGGDGQLHVVVSDRHAQMHSEEVARIAATPATTLHVAAMPSRFDAIFRAPFSRNRLYGSVAKEYATLLRPDHLVLMYFDHAQLAVASGLRFP